MLGPLTTREMTRGDTFCAELPGGGGYGDPLLREPELVMQDVLDRKVSIQAARRDYGVVIDPHHLVVGEAATAQPRSSMQREGTRGA